MPVKPLLTTSGRPVDCNNTYADLTPTEQSIAGNQDISLLRKMDGLQFSDYFMEADQVEAKSHTNWDIKLPTDTFIKAIRGGAYDEAMDGLTQHGFQTNAVAKVMLPWDAHSMEKNNNKKRVFQIGCALLAGKKVNKVNREFYTRERKHQRYCMPPPPEVQQGQAMGTQVSQQSDNESIDDHVMSDNLRDGLFCIGMGKDDGHLASNIDFLSRNKIEERTMASSFAGPSRPLNLSAVMPSPALSPTTAHHIP